MDELRNQFQKNLNRQFLWGYRTAALLLGAFFAFLGAYRLLAPRELALPRYLTWEAMALTTFFLSIFWLAQRIKVRVHLPPFRRELFMSTSFNRPPGPGRNLR